MAYNVKLRFIERKLRIFCEMAIRKPRRGFFISINGEFVGF